MSCEGRKKSDTLSFMFLICKFRAFCLAAAFAKQSKPIAMHNKRQDEREKTHLLTLLDVSKEKIYTYM